jgi:hypothetical protein
MEKTTMEIAERGDTLTPEQRAAITQALQKIAKKQEKIKKYYDYYDGRHSINFASEKFRTAFGDRVQNFRDNLCKIPVKAPADRLEIIGFNQEDNDVFYNDSWTIWKRSQMPKLTKRIHREAFKTGDAYLIVWADDKDKARMYPQDSRNCAVWYDADTGAIHHGAKQWRGPADSDFVYLSLYYPDRIEKYISRSKQAKGNVPASAAGFMPRPIEGEEWPLTHEFGVCPLLHFGLENSILDDAIPLNDALNKSCADLLVSSEANSLRQRWTAGITYEMDAESNEQIIPFKPNAQFVGSDDPNAKFGDFADATLEDFLKVIENWRLEIANATGVPAWYFKPDLGSFPSGEALTKSEARFVGLITDAQLDFGETWAAAIKIAMTIDGKPVKDDKEIEVKWTEAAKMSPNEAADLANKKKNLGVSERQLLSEIGYTDAEIEKMQGENEEAAAAAAESFNKVFDAGTKLAGG